MQTFSVSGHLISPTTTRIFFFRFSFPSSDSTTPLSAPSHGRPLQSSWSGPKWDRLGHQWPSVLWLKELAPCCTCYARGVMFLSSWFTEQSIYWRRFKIHYRLVLPKKGVEQRGEIEVGTGLLQEKTSALILNWSFFCLHSCSAVSQRDI